MLSSGARFGGGDRTGSGVAKHLNIEDTADKSGSLQLSSYN